MRQFFLAMNQYRRLAHFIDVGPELRCALNHRTEEIDPDRLPVGSDQVEHQRGTICVSGLSETIELKIRHKEPRFGWSLA